MEFFLNLIASPLRRKYSNLLCDLFYLLFLFTAKSTQKFVVDAALKKKACFYKEKPVVTHTPGKFPI